MAGRGGNALALSASGKSASKTQGQTELKWSILTNKASTKYGRYIDNFFS